MEGFLQDIRHAFRALRKRPSFTLIAALTLAIGIGINTAIFSLVYGVLFAPLPYEDAERLGMVWTKFEASELPQNWTSEPEFLEMRQYATQFEGLAAFSTSGVNLLEGGEAERLSAARVSAGFFDLLGASATEGRLFRDGDDEPGASEVAVISQDLWRRRFGGDPGIVGDAIRIDGRSVSVAGVAPAGFRFRSDVDLWLPFVIDPANLANRGSHYILVLAKWQEGVTLEQAQAEMVAVGQRIGQDNTGYYGPDGGVEAGWGVYLRSLREEMVGGVRSGLYILWAAVAFVLLIACANVANLFLARASEREREMAVRLALGAGRWRVLRQSLAEAVLLAGFGSIVGVGLATVGIGALQRLGAGFLPRIGEVGIDGTVLFFTLGVSLLAGVLFGLAPGMAAGRLDLHDTLKEGGRGGSPVASRRRRGALVVAETALSLVLLVGAGLLIRTFVNLMNDDPGLDPDNVMTFRASLPSQEYPGDEQRLAFWRSAMERVRNLPTVTGAGVISLLPMSGLNSSGTVGADIPFPEGADHREIFQTAAVEADRRAVTPGYMEAMGMTLTEGRYFTDRDAPDSELVAIVDQDFAERFWPRGGALGERITLGTPGPNAQWRRIVGIVRHVKHQGLGTESRVQTYFPMAQTPVSSAYAAIRTSGEPEQVLPAVRQVFAEIDSDLPIYDAAVMSERVYASVGQPRLYLFLMGVFAAVALLIAAVGIYGVMSYSVNQRVREIGIRMALGADAADVRGLVMRDALLLAATGLAIGVAASLVLSRLMNQLLYRVGAWDPMTYGGVAAVLLGSAALAAWLPARRATAVHPVEALRTE